MEWHFYLESKDADYISGLLAITSFGGYLHLIPYVHAVCDDFLSNEDVTNKWLCCHIKLLPTIRFTTGPEGTPSVFWPSIDCMDISPGNLFL